MNILFFGDSLTWCPEPNTGKRFNKENRWTSLVASQFPKINFSFYGFSGMALEIQPWAKDDFCTTSKENLFVEKIITTQVPDVDYVFLFFGANNYFPTYEKPAKPNDIVSKIERLYNSITARFKIKPIIMNVPHMQLNNGKFTVKELQEAILKRFPNCVRTDRIIPSLPDGVHMTANDNKKISKILIEYINSKILK